MNRCLFGDCRDSMRELIAQGVKVQCVVTSPPYYGLRDYGTVTWEGGDAGCDHVGSIARTAPAGTAKQASNAGSVSVMSGDCRKCGARRVDKQLGLESTPEEFVANMVEVFRLVRELLADDGVMFVNMGDSYLPGKQLAGIPWRVAFALQADGWYLRQEIIWHKPNPMPESVTDRCTKAHEYLFLLAKSERYYYDAEAVMEPVAASTIIERLSQPTLAKQVGSTRVPGKTNGNMKAVGNGETRNRRSVWTIATEPYAEAHFATFPTALVEPCILAGTSQKGHCPACGKGWVRVVESLGPSSWEARKASGSTSGNREIGKIEKQGPCVAHLAPNNAVSTGGFGWVSPKVTTGWQPSCSCSSNLDPVPGIVFDPFLGSGTVGQVAQALGRNWLGCELNEQYRPLQERRTAQQWLMLA